MTADDERVPPVLDPPPPVRLVTPAFAVVVGTALCYFLAYGALLPVLPRYVDGDLGGGGVAVGVAVGAFAVAAGLFRPAAGRLGDRLGRRPLTAGGALVAALATAPMGAVHALWWVVALRFVAGIGEAAFFVGAASAAQDLAPPGRSGEAASLFSVSLYIGLAAGPPTGEILFRHLGPGTFLVAGAVGLGAAAIALLIPGHLGRSTGPIGPRRLLHPAALGPGLVLFLGLLGFAAYSTFVPLYVERLGRRDAGPFFLLYGVLVLAVRVLGARLPDRLGAARTTVGALSAIGIGMAVMAAVATTVGLALGTVLLAAGMSLLFPALFSVAVERAPAAERSHAVGTFSLFFDLAQGLGAPALGLVVSAGGGERGAFAVTSVLALVGLGLARRTLAPSPPSRPAVASDT